MLTSPERHAGIHDEDEAIVARGYGPGRGDQQALADEERPMMRSERGLPRRVLEVSPVDSYRSPGRNQGGDIVEEAGQRRLEPRSVRARNAGFETRPSALCCLAGAGLDNPRDDALRPVVEKKAGNGIRGVLGQIEREDDPR